MDENLIETDDNHEAIVDPKMDLIDNTTPQEMDPQITEISEKSSTYQYPPLFTTKTLLELCNSSWSRPLKAKDSVQPYLRGCKWSPDGTCCLTVVNNDGIQVMELPKDLYEGSVSATRIIDVLDPVIHVKEAGLVYDFCWFPGMNSGIPESCWLVLLAYEISEKNSGYRVLSVNDS